MSSFLAAHALTLGAAFVCVLAWAKGAAAERAGAALIAAVWALSMLVPTSPYLMLAVDGAAASGFLVLALMFSRVWLGVAMLLQAAALFLHSSFLAGDGSHMRAYVERENLLSVGVLSVLLCAVVTTWGARVWARRKAEVEHVAATSTGRLGSSP